MSAHGVKSMVTVISGKHVASQQFVWSVDRIRDRDTSFCFRIVGTAVACIRACSVCMEPDDIFSCFLVIQHLWTFHDASFCPQVHIDIFLLCFCQISVQILEVIICLELFVVVHGS